MVHSTNTKIRVLIFALMIGGAFLLPQMAEGKSVSWSKTYDSASWTVNDPVLGSMTKENNVFGYDAGSGTYLTAAKNINISVSYGANITDANSGVVINDGAALPVGACFDVTPKSYSDQDISWFGQSLPKWSLGWDPGCCGTVFDSPNGHWISNASAPALTCSAQDYIGSSGSGTDGYLALSVNPPQASVTTSGSTAGLTPQGGNRFCVTSPGNIAIQTSFLATSGKYYFREQGGVCSGNNTPMVNGERWNDGGVLGNLMLTTDQFSLDVPTQAVNFNLTAVSNNNPPNPPSLTGPTTGSTNTNYPYATQASDPDGDTLRYGIDWDNNGSVDEWTAYLASNTAINTNHSWVSTGSYTFQALAQDSNGATSGWSTPLTITINSVVNGTCGAANAFPTTNPPTIGLCISGTPTPVTPGVAPGPYSWTCTGSGGGTDSPVCTAPYLEPAPVVDLKINGSDGPLTIPRNNNLNITWGNVANAVTCSGTGNSWTGAKVITGGSDNIQATAASLYTLTCTNSQGISSSDSISITLQPTLKICQNSCSSSIEPPSSFSMQKGDTRDLFACYNDATSCTDSTGDVTTSATWSEGGGNPVSLSGSTPKRVSADNPGTESIQASYNSQSVTRNISVTCTDSGACQRDANYNKLCQKDTYTVVDSCGVTQNCNGTKTCDYNWKEVAP